MVQIGQGTDSPARRRIWAPSPRRRLLSGLVLLAVAGACSGGSKAPSAGGPGKTTPAAKTNAVKTDATSKPPRAADGNQLERVAFNLNVLSGTFVKAPDGSITGTLRIDPSATWSDADTNKSGTIETVGALNIAGQNDSPAVISVRDAAKGQDLASIELRSLSYDDATSTWKYTGVPINPSANPAGPVADAAFAGDVDPSIPPSFGNAKLVIYHDGTEVTSNGTPTVKGVTGGNVMVGVGSDVSVTTSLDDFNCVDSQSFPGFKTKAFAELQPFQADWFTFSHGCATRSSWVRWNVTVGAPWNDSGKIWLGQDSPGGRYYSNCIDWKKVVCLSQAPGKTPQASGTGLQLLAPRCRELRTPGYPSSFAQDRGVTCSVWGEGNPFNNTPWFYTIDLHWSRGVNVGRTSCTVDKIAIASGQTESIRGGGVYMGTSNDGPCSLVLTP